jgi:hypothetical protein
MLLIQLKNGFMIIQKKSIIWFHNSITQKTELIKEGTAFEEIS